MARYFARRCLWAVMLFLAVTLVTYVIFFIIPANPAALAAGKTATPERIAAVEKGLRPRRSRLCPVREVPEAARRRPLARLLVRNGVGQPMVPPRAPSFCRSPSLALVCLSPG
jgi:hypothetical protein